MIKIDLIKITQFESNDIYIGKALYSDLKNKVRSTVKKKVNDGAYQRPLNKAKLKEISTFLQNFNGTVPPFATPLILSLKTDEEILLIENDGEENIIINERFKNNNNTAILTTKHEKDLLSKDLTFFKLIIPNEEENIFIVDGQHRFFGFEKYLQDMIDKAKKENTFYQDEDIEFPITFLLNYDVYEQSEVFMNTNFNQQAVNRSLHFAIFGEMPGRNSYTYSHFLVKAVNDSFELNGIIKMLGTGPGVLSLAFMSDVLIDEMYEKNKIIKEFFTAYEDFKTKIEIDSIIDELNDGLDKDTLKKKGKIYEQLIEYKNLSDKGKIIDEIFDRQNMLFKKFPEVLIDYLTFYKNKFNNYFPIKISHKHYSEPIYSSYHYRENYMFKATGMFGILKVFSDLIEDKHIIIDGGYSQQYLFDILEDKLALVIEQPDYFFKNQKMLGSGSASLQKKFYQVLREAIYSKIKIEF